MRVKPRTICRPYSLAFLALILIFFSTPAWSQQRGRAKPSPATQSQTAERARRAQAISLLVETADKARLFDDLFYRARVQALAADALWPNDQREARVIFRRAWEAAAASDKEAQEEAAREVGVLPSSVAKVTEARDEVLKMAAVRDARLAEIFLRDLVNDKDEKGAARNEQARNSAWRELSATAARRLALAYEMLEASETRRAAEIAAPVINEGVNVDLITFIARLSPRDWNAADALYLRLLERAAADPATDANAILMLSSRFVSPMLLVSVDEFGSLQFRSLPHPLGSFSGMMLPTPSGKQAFYTLAANVLSRPVRSGDGQLTMQDLIARFYAAGRLLPFFENSSEPYASFAPTLRVRQSELFNVIEASRREQVSSQFSLSSLTQTATTDPLRLPTEQLARATEPMERERIAVSMVRTAVHNRSWDRARRAAEEIENMDLRHAALSFIQVHQIKDISKAYEDEKEDDFEGIVKFVRAADVPPFAKAWGLAQAALIAARKRTPQTAQTVAQILDEAAENAARVERGKPERVAAYGVVAMAAARLDAERAWGLLRELVKTANGVEDFTGDEVSFDLAADENSTGEAAEQFSVDSEVFRLDGIFATMAQLDFDKALAEARALEGDVPQAFATIAVAKSRIQESGVRSQNKN
jgi:hypothetical protein